MNKNPKGQRKHRGAVSELTACAWLLEQGWEVFRNVSPHGPADIVIFKAGEFRKVDVKTAYLHPRADGGAPSLTCGALYKEPIPGVHFLLVTPDNKCLWASDFPRAGKTR